MTTESFATAYLLFFVLPAWVVTGFVDWLCHRAAKIEQTAGPAESVIHILGLSEVAIALILGLFCDINALVILILTAVFVAHEITFTWDVKFAAAHREITPTEQRVHDYLSGLSLVALSTVYFLHWKQLLAIGGLGPESARFTFTQKMTPLSPTYIYFFLALVIVFGLIPFAEALCANDSCDNLSL